MIHTFRQAVYKHGYLIITAAWLYTLSFIFIHYWSYNASPEKVKNKLEQRIARQEEGVKKILADTALLTALITDTSSSTKTALVQEPFGLFVYTVNNLGTPLLSYWNTNHMYVNGEDLYRKDSSYFVLNRNGEFELVKQNVNLRSQRVMVMALIPVRWLYFIENKYLHSDFAGYNGLNKQYEISMGEDALPVHNSNGQELFRIKLKPGKLFIAYDSITVLLRVLAIILLLIFCNSLARELMVTYGFRKGFVFLLSVVLLLRFISYHFSFPFDFSKLPLFDPSIYASNFLHPSLGDLLVNAVLLFWLVNFYKNHTDHRNWLSRPLPSRITDYGYLLVLTLICFLLTTVIKSLVQDSKISMDVTNFFSLNIYSMISFVIFCFLVLTFFHFSQLLVKPLIDRAVELHEQLIVVVLSGFLYILLFTRGAETRVDPVVLAWLLGYVALLNLRKSDMSVPLLRSSFFIFWVMLFAISIAAMVMYQNRVVEFAQRKRIAEKLALQTDPSGESLLNIAATNFDDHFLLTNYHRLESEYSNKFIKDSLISQNFSGYLNKYDTRIYTFDSLYHPLFNEDSLNYAAIKTIILNKAKPISDIPELYSYDNSADGFSYLYQKMIRDGKNTLGYLYVIIKSKRYKSEALYPELFNQVSDLSSDLNTNYAYAIYNKGKLINHFNNYSFPSQLAGNQIPGFEFTYRKVDGYSELWFNSGGNKQVLVVKQNTWLTEFVTLFAYLFCFFLLILFLFHIGNYFLEVKFRWVEMRKFFLLNIRTQIQATIIFLSVFSFLVIGVATISFFIIRFNSSNEDRLTKSIQVMANEINSKVNAQIIFDDVLTVHNIGVTGDMERTISEISDLHNVDINFYDVNGNLRISTQPYIYNKHLLSEKMEPLAFQQLHYDHTIRYIQSEKVGLFDYLSIYVPLTDERGVNYAYLNIPYLNSQNELNQEISGFLATLINLNAFIFLMAGAIAFFLTNRITASFSLIGDKMRQMNLGKINEEIEWNRNDEIGMLVSEYNKMVKKLEQSAQALAQSEREGAWREMARQVAHEIKNPLTPMKLSIQYLQRSIENGAPNIKELSSNMAVTLIEQIEQLSKIAGDFSQFANIGNAVMEEFDIMEVLASLVRLYRSNPRMDISWERPLEKYEVFSDRVQMNRLFTNLLQNAVEACEDKEKTIKVVITQQIEHNQLIIAMEDESGGIPASLQHNIFTPNFTTKSSGTGLGLAICKGIIEKANGRIWFETKEGVGTTFFVQLPLRAIGYREA
ncbi:MAG: HAMP domain-containing sensor histidine kinase [Sediminibacterium sp.]